MNSEYKNPEHMRLESASPEDMRCPEHMRFESASPEHKNSVSRPAPVSQPVLSVHGLSKTFGSRKALDLVTFELPPESFLVILGSNGAGKSTLLRTLVTLIRPTAGKASVLGWDLREHPEEIRARIGLVSHRSMLYLDLTAEENLLTIARLAGLPTPQARVSELLDAVELTARRHDLVRGFSRGMTQRLSIARALLGNPGLLFLDEPYSGLDPRAVSILDGLLSELRTGRSLVMVSHDVEKSSRLASHILTLDKGRVVSFGEA